MAVVNRYTQTTPARYNPRTFDEMMVPAAYMREQHNALDLGMAEIGTAITKTDPLDIHSDAAKAEQQRLYDQITEQADILNKEGFNPAAKSKFMKLNQDYQQAVSPTGVLGKINNAKAMLAKNKEAFMAGSIEAGYDPRAMEQNWRDFEEIYNAEFEESGRITPIGELYPPEYFDYMAEAKEIFKEAGVNATDIIRGSGKIIENPDGSGYVINSENRDVTDSNEAALKDAVNWLNNNIMNPNSTAGRSIEFQRKTGDQVLQEIAGLENVYKNSKTIDSKVSKITSRWNPENGNDVTNKGRGLFMAGRQVAAAKFSDKPFSEAKDVIAELELRQEEQGELSKEDEQILYEAKQYQDRVEEVLASDPEYQEFSNYYDALEEKVNGMMNGTYNLNADTDYLAGLGMINDSKAAGNITNEMYNQAVADYRRNFIDGKRNALAGTRKELDKIVNTASQNIQKAMTNYSFDPIGTKQVSRYKNINNSIERGLLTNPQNILSMMDIQELQLEGEAISDLTQKDKEGIAEIIRNIDKNSIELLAVTPRDFQDKPGYTLRIKTDENNSYDLDNPGIFDTRGDIGGGEYVNIRVNFNEAEAEDTDIRNINGMVEDYIASVGPDGQELVDYQRQVRATRQYPNTTWEQMTSSPEFMANTTTGQTLRKMWASLLMEEGITAESTEQQVKEAEKKIIKDRVSPLNYRYSATPVDPKQSAKDSKVLAQKTLGSMLGSLGSQSLEKSGLPEIGESIGNAAEAVVNVMK